jgi:hypothetical protein
MAKRDDAREEEDRFRGWSPERARRLSTPMSTAHLRPAIERVIAALREALLDPDFDRGRYDFGGKRLAVRTTAAEAARVLPTTGRPVRGADGVEVDVSSIEAPRRLHSINNILSHAFNAQGNTHDYRWPEVDAASMAFADAVYDTPVLGHRVFESIGYKYYDVAQLDEQIAARRTDMKHPLVNMEAQLLLQGAVVDGLHSLGLEETPQLTPAGLAGFERWGAVVDHVERELGKLHATTEHAYTVTAFLNGPLLEHDAPVILADLGDNDGLCLRGEIALAPATDEDLATTTHHYHTPLHLPAGVESTNAVLRFRLALPVNASVEEYRQLYPFAVNVARRLLDAIRVVTEDDISISFVGFKPTGKHTPHAPTNYAWEYQPQYTAYVPRRIASSPPQCPPLTAEQIDELRRLARLRLDDTDVKGFPVAIRRFRDSYERYEPGDPERLLDLAIALEALFLNDEDTKEQLRFRLSLRIARFLEADVDARVRIFLLVRDLYDMRSKVAHGATLDTLRSKDATKLATLQVEAPRITRRAIAKLLDGAGPVGLKDQALREWWRRLELS